MSIIAWIILGLIVAILGKWIMSSRENSGFIMTVALGIAGALIGGFIGNHLLGLDIQTGFSIKSLALSTLGAVLLLYIYRKIKS